VPDLTAEEKEYIEKIYRNGLNQLSEDSIPNIVIAVHNIHWCVEALLRKATETWNSVGYKDGFAEILDQFKKKHGNHIAPNAIRAVERLNNIRNNIEHYKNFPSLPTLKEVLPDVYLFVKWISTNALKSEIDVYSIPSVDMNVIKSDFFDWKNKQLKGFEKDDNVVFLCIIPASMSPDLINLDADNINDMKTVRMQSGVVMAFPNQEHHPELENYLRSYGRLMEGQVYTVPDFIRSYDEYQNETRVFPDGRIYVQLYYQKFNKQKGTREELEAVNLEYIFRVEEGSTTYSEANTRYKPPFERYGSRSFGFLLKMLLWPFHPDCPKKMVKIPTKNAAIILVIPHMLTEKNRGRALFEGESRIFPSFREYLGESDDIVCHANLDYDSIDEVIQTMKARSFGFFKNKADTSFG
jgi:hypothetical protein